MPKTRDVIAYLCANYPPRRQGDLSKARVTKLVYLADWRSAIQRDRQITPIAWYFNHYGPFVPDVIDAVAEDPAFELRSTENAYGTDKELVVLAAPDPGWPTLGADDPELLDEVIEQTRDLNYSEFIRLVYSTYPVLSQPRYTTFDLPLLARRYRRERAAIQAAGNTG